MDIDPKSKRAMENMFFEGIVSSQDAASGTVRVTRPDKGDKVTGPMVVGVRGTKATKDFWMPAIGDQVLCLQLPNFSGKGVGEGWVLAARYSSVDTPPKGAAADVRVLSHPGDVVIDIGGTLTINAGTLEIKGGGDVVASGISLAGHTHGGVTSGGSSTSGPQ